MLRHKTKTRQRTGENEDLVKDSVYGTSSDKALEFLKGKPSTTVVVAVIDGGVYYEPPCTENTCVD